MKNNRVIGSIILILFFVLSVFLMFIIPTDVSIAIWITLAFDIISFGSQLILGIMLFQKGKNNDVFYKTPIITVSIIYMLLQFVICLVVAFTASIISGKITIILNFVTCIVMWSLIIALLSSKNYEMNVDSRQKNHHIEL